MDNEFIRLLICFLGGIAVFYIGFRITTKNANKVDTETLKEEWLTHDDEEENPLASVLLGTFIMCIGAIPVGGVLLGWNSKHILGGLWDFIF